MSSASVRAIEASQKISGIFNIASGNYTVGEVGDLVKMAIEEQLGRSVGKATRLRRSLSLCQGQG